MLLPFPSTKTNLHWGEKEEKETKMSVADTVIPWQSVNKHNIYQLSWKRSA